MFNQRHKKVLISGLFLIVTLGAVGYSVWGFMTEHSAKVIDEKYQSEMDRMLHLLAEEERESTSGTTDKQKKDILESIARKKTLELAAISDQKDKEEKEVEEISQTGISLDDINIRAVPNITDIGGQSIH